MRDKKVLQLEEIAAAEQLGRADGMKRFRLAFDLDKMGMERSP